MIRSILIDLNPVELNYSPFMIPLDKCNRSCNVVDDICMKQKTEMLKCLMCHKNK